MATVKEIYQLIKEREKQGKKIGILQQSIIAAIASCKASRFYHLHVILPLEFLFEYQFSR